MLHQHRGQRQQTVKPESPRLGQKLEVTRKDPLIPCRDQQLPPFYIHPSTTLRPFSVHALQNITVFTPPPHTHKLYICPSLNKGLSEVDCGVLKAICSEFKICEIEVRYDMSGERERAKGKTQGERGKRGDSEIEMGKEEETSWESFQINVEMINRSAQGQKMCTVWAGLCVMYMCALVGIHECLCMCV